MHITEHLVYICHEFPITRFGVADEFQSVVAAGGLQASGIFGSDLLA